MGWISLSLRKQTLKAGIAQEQLRLLQISREVRGEQRHMSLEKTIFQVDKDEELRTAKKAFDDVKKDRVSSDDAGYDDWKAAYDDAKIEYEDQKVSINDYYDDIFNDLEQESQDKQTTLEDEQTTVEAQLSALQSELESVSEQIKTDIQNSAIKFS